jgi:hypothetical protein
VQNTNTTTPAFVGTGDGSTPAEMYQAFDPNDPLSTTPIAPGGSVLLKNSQTGRYCRLVPVPTAPTLQGMQCDLETAASATSFTYTGRPSCWQGRRHHAWAMLAAAVLSLLCSACNGLTRGGRLLQAMASCTITHRWSQRAPGVCWF